MRSHWTQHQTQKYNSKSEYLLKKYEVKIIELYSFILLHGPEWFRNS